MSDAPTVEDARTLHAASENLLEQARKRAAELTAGGREIDEHQVLTERVAYAATEARAIRELIQHVDQARSEGIEDRAFELACVAGAAELARRIHDRLAPVVDELGLSHVIEGDIALV